MAFLTVYRRAHELLAPLAQMAGVTVGDGVNAYKRKASFDVGAQNVLAVPPISGRMTTGAIKPELASMDVRMTIGTVDSGVSEPEVMVTTGAAYTAMDANQRKTGLVVVNRQRVAKLLPRLRGMTEAAIPLDLAMRIRGLRPGRQACPCSKKRQHGHRQPHGHDYNYHPLFHGLLKLS